MVALFDDLGDLGGDILVEANELLFLELEVVEIEEVSLLCRSFSCFN
jgi:hypothetical protein